MGKSTVELHERLVEVAAHAAGEVGDPAGDGARLNEKLRRDVSQAAVVAALRELVASTLPTPMSTAAIPVVDLVRLIDRIERRDLG